MYFKILKRRLKCVLNIFFFFFRKQTYINHTIFKKTYKVLIFKIDLERLLELYPVSPSTKDDLKIETRYITKLSGG